MTESKMLAGEKLPAVTGGVQLSNSDQAKLIAGLERRLYEARSEVDRLKKLVTGGAAPAEPDCLCAFLNIECPIHDKKSLARGAAQTTPEKKYE